MVILGDRVDTEGFIFFEIDELSEFLGMPIDLLEINLKHLIGMQLLENASIDQHPFLSAKDHVPGEVVLKWKFYV